MLKQLLQLKEEARRAQLRLVVAVMVSAFLSGCFLPLYFSISALGILWVVSAVSDEYNAQLAYKIEKLSFSIYRDSLADGIQIRSRIKQIVEINHPIPTWEQSYEFADSEIRKNDVLDQIDETIRSSIRNDKIIDAAGGALVPLLLLIAFGIGVGTARILNIS